MYNCSVLAMEYPGYGFFQNQIIEGQCNKKKKMSTSPKIIKKCARRVFTNVITPLEQGGLGYNSHDVIIFGRSSTA